MTPPDYKSGPRSAQGNRPPPGRNTAQAPSETLDTSGIRLKAAGDQPLPADLFDSVAQRAAQQVAGDKNNSKNKPSQLRQFYDEVVMWEEKLRRKPEDFDKYLPFIRMLNAKVAYAEGRKHVDANFVTLLHHGLAQVDDVQTLRNFKLFFEAFMGFYKVERPSG
jgi:CRISPR-associated protein Csm2